MKESAFSLSTYIPPLQRVLALEAGGLVCASGDNPDNEDIPKKDDEVGEDDVDTRRFNWDWN
ncbi:MAG: hypothetical protein J6M53_04970 [Bacteroidaceae bacterium]|nr:hypothetical protein [Bacteroidaceae bacterium]